MTVTVSVASALLTLGAQCPHCRHRPRLRTEPWMRTLLESVSGDAVVVTYQCHRCGKVYAVRARHFAGAA